MKTKLFIVTAKDCEWDYFRGTGKGGQKRNKTSNAVRCRHLPSGAIGVCQEGRSQFQNRKVAFRRMAETREFKKWAHIEASRKTGLLIGLERQVNRQIEEKIEKELNDPNITIVEILDCGKWKCEHSLP